MSKYLKLIPSDFIKEKNDKFNKYPGKKSVTVSGEIVRAYIRIFDRYYNNYNFIDYGKGYAMVNPCYRYLCSVVPGASDVELPSFGCVEHMFEYEKFLYELQEVIQTYLEDHPELDETKNTKDSRIPSIHEKQKYENWKAFMKQRERMYGK